MKGEVLRLGSALQDLTAKYQREREEKDRIVAMIQGEETGIVDALKFKEYASEKEQLLRTIEELKASLLEEKGLKINSLYEIQEAQARIDSLNEENNVLNNVRSELTKHLSSIKLTHQIEVGTLEFKIQQLEEEIGFLQVKLVMPCLRRTV